jgi:nucleotide-binding universal stress UspA family protein
MKELQSRGRIVVGVDGSPAATRAAYWAAEEATRRHCGLDVVHAWMTPYPINPTDVFTDPAPFEAQGWEVLNRTISSLAPREKAPFDVRPVLVEAYAAEGLLSACDAAELLVVGSRGRGGFSGLLLGSVSQHCIHRAPCPVVVIPTAWTGGENHRVVVGVDGSAESYPALKWAIFAAAIRRAHLDVVHAYDYVQSIVPMELGPGIDRETLEKGSRTLLEQMVEPALEATDERPAAVALHPKASGPARALLDAAVGADLLVVGSRGRSGMRGLLLGSVSLQCVHHATCPVVVVRVAPELRSQLEQGKEV